MESFDLKKFQELVSKIPTNTKNKDQLSLDELIALRENTKDAYNRAKEYATSRVFVLTDGRYVMMIDNVLSFMKPIGFNESYGNRIKKLNKEIYDEITINNLDMYSVDVYNESFLIDKTRLRINLKQQPKYTLTQFVPSPKQREGVKTILEYLKDVICSKDENTYQFLLDWITIAFRGDQSQCILTLYTLLEGTGKTKFIELLQEVMGNAMTGISQGQLSGADNFNSNLIGKSIIFIEETTEQTGNADHNKAIQTLKQLSTASSYSYRAMQKVSEEKNNFSNIVISSNNRVNCGRRSFYPVIDTSKLEDKDYYSKVSKCISNQGTMQFFFNTMVNRKVCLEDFRKKPIPTSESSINEQKDAMKPVFKFIADKYILEEKPAQKEKRSEIYDDYKLWHTNVLKSDARYISRKSTVFDAFREMKFELKKDGDGIMCFYHTEETKKWLYHVFVEVKKWITIDDITEYRLKQKQFARDDEEEEKPVEVKKEIVEKPVEVKEEAVKKKEHVRKVKVLTPDDVDEVMKIKKPKKIDCEKLKNHLDTLEKYLF